MTVADPLPATERTFARARIVPAIIVGLAGLALVGGAVVVAADQGDVVADGRALVTGFYADRDGGALVERIVPGSLRPDESDDLEARVQAVLEQGGAVVDARPVTVRGVDLAQVETDDGITWCVRPDERIVLFCRVAVAEVTAGGGDAPLELRYGAIDVYPGRAELVVVLSTTGEESYQVEGRIQLWRGDEPADLERRTLALVAQGQEFEVDETDVRVDPGYGLLLVYTGDAAAADTIAPGDLELRWGNGQVPLRVTEPNWFVG